MPLFQSTCPARGTTQRRTWLDLCSYNFNPRAPRGARRRPRRRVLHEVEISIHVPREGHDSEYLYFPAASEYFNPRAPRGARLVATKNVPSALSFQSTCPARGTTSYTDIAAKPLGISIHVPREGHDYSFKPIAISHCISIHVPREGHDEGWGDNCCLDLVISIHVPREGHDSTQAS